MYLSAIGFPLRVRRETFSRGHCRRYGTSAEAIKRRCRGLESGVRPRGRRRRPAYDEGRDGARLATDGPHGARAMRGPVGRALTLSVKLPLLSLS